LSPDCDGRYASANIIQKTLACVQQNCFSALFYPAQLRFLKLALYVLVTRTREDNDKGDMEGDDPDIEDHEQAMEEMVVGGECDTHVKTSKEELSNGLFELVGNLERNPSWMAIFLTLYHKEQMITIQFQGVNVSFFL
jgi:hypothetical protein